MMLAHVDSARRRMLTRATTAVGALGVGLWSVPFLRSLAPSEKARAPHRYESDTTLVVGEDPPGTA